MKRLISRWLDIAVWIAAMTLAHTAAAADNGGISVTVDRHEVRAGESFVLTFEAGKFDDEPDFAPLDKDFEILGNSRRTNIAINNGSMSKSTAWQLKLIPRHEGEIAIPAIAFGKDRSPPLVLTVAAAGSGPGANADNTAMRLEVSATPQTPYVQAQVLLSVRLYVPDSIDLVDSSFGDPRITGGDALVTALGKVRERSTFDKGVRVRIFERDYAIFPQQHGRMVIEPMTFEGQVFEGTATADDPFGQSIRTYQLQSKPLTLDIKPVPAEFKGQHWLPAEKLDLVENWSDDVSTLKAGEPVTRSLTLMAKGLTAGQLPEIDAAKDTSLSNYPEQPTLDDQARSDGVTGLRMEKHALIAQTAGSHTLPEIRIPWWNTRTDRLEVAALPARTIEVAGDAAPKLAESVKEKTTPARIEGAPPAPDAKTNTSGSTPGAMPRDWLWPMLSLILAVGWALSMTAWWLSHRRRTQSTDGASPSPSIRQLHAAVLAHARTNDAATTRAALLKWAAANEVVNPSIELIAQRFPALATDLREMENQLYSNGGASHWSGAALSKAFAAMRTRIKVENHKAVSADGLPPLYPTPPGKSLR